VHGAAADLVRHLATHGISADVDERLALRDETIGQRFGDYVAAVRPDLLVMGGFGHTRFREFVLGGATRAMLEAPPCPVLMAH
jgi:nucleotide-binding universal stress UspA family protein